MILSPNHSLELILFYLMAGAIFWVLLAWVKSFTLPSIVRGLALASSIIIVGSEYYEIPVFLAQYFGLMGYSFPALLTILNHVNVFLAFLFFIWVSKLKITKKNVFILLVGPCLTAIFLFGNHILFLARTIGLTMLFLVAKWGDKHE